MTDWKARARVWSSSIAGRLVLLTAVWWAIVEGDRSVIAYGFVVVPLAVLASLCLHAPGEPSAIPLRRRLTAFAVLVVWFVWRSFLGGVDVARRAVSRPVGLAPVFVTYKLRLSQASARVAVVDLASLMPGTLSADLDGNVLVIHVLHEDMPAADLVAELEDRVERMVGPESDGVDET